MNGNEQKYKIYRFVIRALYRICIKSSMKNMYKFIKRLTQRLYNCHIEVVYCCKILLVIRIRSEFTIYRLYIYYSISVINNYGLVSSLN